MTHSFAQKILDSRGQPISSNNPLSTTKGFNIPVYDDMVLSYDVDGNLSTIVYKYLTVVVATLTFTYVDSNLTRIEKS